MFSINEKCLNKTENIYEPNSYYYKGLDKLENNYEKFDTLRGNERYKYDLGAVDTQLYKLQIKL